MHLWAGDCPGRRSGCWSLWGQGRAGTPGLGTTPGEGQTCGALGVQERDEAETWTGLGADTTAGLKLGAGAGRDRLYLLPAPLAVAELRLRRQRRGQASGWLLSGTGPLPGWEAQEAAIPTSVSWCLCSKARDNLQAARQCPPARPARRPCSHVHLLLTLLSLGTST